MTKIFWGINIPYQSQRINWEKSKGYPHEKPVYDPCIRVYEKLSFELCDVCGNQVIGGRAKRRLTTCSPKCHAAKHDGWLFVTEQREREYVGERPTYFWGKIRDECFKRDNNACQKCGKGPEKKMVMCMRLEDKKFVSYEAERIVQPDIHCHHIIPIKDGGSNKLENLITLCSKCHKIEHSHYSNIAKQHKALSDFF